MIKINKLSRMALGSYIKEKMENPVIIGQGPWIADLAAMTCRNIENKMVVKFIETGKSLTPEIDDIPLSLLSTIARKKHDVSYLQKQVEEAEDVFLRAYFKTKTSG
jgi:hypothetical protein